MTLVHVAHARFMPSALIARIPPIPRIISWRSRISSSPPYRVAVMPGRWLRFEDVRVHQVERNAAHLSFQIWHVTTRSGNSTSMVIGWLSSPRIR